MDVTNLIKNELERIVASFDITEGVNYVIEIPKDTTKGDYATNLAMQLTRILRKNPREIASLILEKFDKEKTGIEKIEIAGPGFINFFVKSTSFSSLINKVLESKDDFGKQNYGNNKKYDIEFVSANPTGDLHLGHAWQAALGDSICNLLEEVGYNVTREYYVNDAGVQIQNLANSIYARYKQALNIDTPFPENGYHGKDIIEFGNELAKKYQMSKEDFLQQFGGIELIKYDLEVRKTIDLLKELNK